MDLDSDYCSNDSDGNLQDINGKITKPKLPEDKSVTFILTNDERIQIPDKEVLIRKSPVFNDLLICSKGSEIKVGDWDPKAFKAFLKYLQTDTFKSSECSQYAELIKLCVQYEVPKLLAQVCPLAKQSITLENCVDMYVLGATNDVEDLRLAAHNFFLRMGNAFLEHASFLQLDNITLSILISSDDFPVLEITLFKRLKEWVVAQCKRIGYPPDRKEFFGRVAGLLFRHVRYAQMTPKEFRSDVVPSGLLNETDIEGINLRHRTHPGLWYMLPPYQFADRPRMTKLQFAVPIYNNVQIGFRKIAGTSNIIQESLRFMVSHDIYLTSIGFFGPAKSDRCANGSPLTAYTIRIHVEGDYLKHHLRCPPQCATVITRDNFMVDLSHPFQIQKFQPYKLTVWVDGEVTQFGVFPLPQAIVLIQDRGELITFHFSDADSDPKPALDTSGSPTSAVPALALSNHNKHEPRISGVIRCISFIIKD